MLLRLIVMPLCVCSGSLFAAHGCYAELGCAHKPLAVYCHGVASTSSIRSSIWITSPECSMYCSSVERIRPRQPNVSHVQLRGQFRVPKLRIILVAGNEARKRRAEAGPRQLLCGVGLRLPTPMPQPPLTNEGLKVVFFNSFRFAVRTENDPAVVEPA